MKETNFLHFFCVHSLHKIHNLRIVSFSAGLFLILLNEFSLNLALRCTPKVIMKFGIGICMKNC